MQQLSGKYTDWFDWLVACTQLYLPHLLIDRSIGVSVIEMVG